MLIRLECLKTSTCMDKFLGNNWHPKHRAFKQRPLTWRIGSNQGKRYGSYPYPYCQPWRLDILNYQHWRSWQSFRNASCLVGRQCISMLAIVWAKFKVAFIQRPPIGPFKGHLIAIIVYSPWLTLLQVPCLSIKAHQVIHISVITIISCGVIENTW